MAEATQFATNDRTTAATTVTWIIGAGSGVGRASAIDLAGSGRTLVLSGRGQAGLDETAKLVRDSGGTAIPVALDVRDDAAVREAHSTITGQVGTVTEVVFCAGMNVTKRSWRELDASEFRDVVDTNLTSVAVGISTVLSGMRECGYGRVVVISSWAGWTLGRGAGVAYSASKTALASLTEQLNDQECHNGISACVVCPGDINTGFVDKRPTVPDSAARAKMLTPADVARAVAFVITSPAHMCVNELVISPVHSHSYGK